MDVLCGLGDSADVPKVAKTRLVEAVKALIDILDEVDKYPVLYLNRRILREAIYRYEHRWIPLLASVRSAERINLVPPLDVEWVWFCHMLCPLRYIADSAAMWNAVRSDERDFVIDHKLTSGRRRKKGKEKASRIWKQLFPKEPFEVQQSFKDAPIRENGFVKAGDEHRYDMIYNSLISYDIVAAAERQMAFHYQVSLMPQYRDSCFLRYAMDRYLHKFLTLHACFPDEVWVPTYDIDVVWHAHMMHPRWYKESTEQLLGSILPHNDAINDRSKGSELDLRWNETVKQWTETFSDPIIREGGMWRGNVEADERIQRPYIRKLIECVNKKTQIILDKHVESYDRAGMHNQVEFSVSYGGDVNWQDTKIGWVHMTDWRRANLPVGRANLESTENKIERLTFLKHSERYVLLTCRSVHFLMYNEQEVPNDFRTVLEIFSNSPNIPVATAHHILHDTMCDSYASSSCKRKEGESVLLLRVGGEDFGLLGGKWEGFEAPEKGTDSSKGTRGYRGSLNLRLWLLDKKGTSPQTARKWKESRRIVSSKLPGKYSLVLPVRDAGGVTEAEEIRVDLEKATVEVRHATHTVPAYLIGMAAAALHVALQPRFLPEEGVLPSETMYPEWSVPQHPYTMLRGAGGEKQEAGSEIDNSGLWIMLYRNLESTSPSEKSFSGYVSAIRAPAGAVPGGCGGCGGNCATCEERSEKRVL